MDTNISGSPLEHRFFSPVQLQEISGLRTIQETLMVHSQ
jgi:hypothetical protein